MRKKIQGVCIFLVLFAWLFQIDVSAQKNEQLLSRKKEASSLSNVSGAVLDEINTARQKPQQFIAYLEEYRGRFSGSNVKGSDGITLRTIEGVAVIDEAIAFLRSLTPVEPLKITEGLVKAATLQLNDLSINPSLYHTGADGSSLSERVKRLGTTRGKLGENIAFGKSIAREIVLMWIIDDGIPSRLHRKNLFNSEFKTAGTAYGKGTDDRGLCVLVLAAEFSEKGASPAIESF